MGRRPIFQYQRGPNLLGQMFQAWADVVSYFLFGPDIDAAEVAASTVAKGTGRSLADILADDGLFRSWFRSSRSPDNPYSLADSQTIWDALTGRGMNPRLDPGHPGTTWDVPHINVDGRHIPVDPAFKP